MEGDKRGGRGERREERGERREERGERREMEYAAVKKGVERFSLVLFQFLLGCCTGARKNGARYELPLFKSRGVGVSVSVCVSVCVCVVHPIVFFL